MGWYQPTPLNPTHKEVTTATSSNFPTSAGMGQYKSFKNGVSASSNPLRRMKQVGRMADSDIGRSVIDVYSEEATQPDVRKQKCVWFECINKDVEDRLNSLLDRINIEQMAGQIMSGIIGTGNNFNRVVYGEQGIIKLADVEEPIRRLYHPQTKALLGFLWEGQEPEVPFYSDQTKVFAPWDFIHFRRLAQPGSEYGVSLIDHLYELWRKIELATDQMVIYRLHTMPSRHVCMVDCGTMDYTSAMEQVKMAQTFMRSSVSVGEDGLNSKFNPPSIDSMLYIAKRTGEDTSFETLSGDREVPDVHDLEHLLKAFFGGARVPKDYVGYGDDSGIAQASLVTKDIRFARGVRMIRRAFINGIQSLGQFELAFHGIDPLAHDISVHMSPVSAIEEELNAEILERQVNAVSSLTSLLQNLGVTNKDIIRLAFTEYMKLPKDFIKVAMLAAQVNQAVGGEDEGGLGMPPSMGMGGGGSLGGSGLDEPDLGSPSGDDLDLPDEDVLLDSRDKALHRKLLHEAMQQIAKSDKRKSNKVKSLLKEFNESIERLSDPSSGVSLVERFANENVLDFSLRSLLSEIAKTSEDKGQVILSESSADKVDKIAEQPLTEDYKKSIGVGVELSEELKAAEKEEEFGEAIHEAVRAVSNARKSKTV